MAWLRTFVTACVLAAPAWAQEAPEVPDAPEPPMTYERLGRIIFALDENAQPMGTGFQLSISGVPMLVVTDPAADRMRAMVPLRPAEGLTAEELMRMMQANFDTALDARYAVARGQLWAVFIHPLSPLEKDQLISSLGQTVNIARTYGTLYTGGALQFGGGDSPGIQRQLIEELLEKGEEI
ncbi:hypothetical protein RA19_09045 [Leisingera sp. ANG-M1]|uniref:hypothetical protein n=1 Tax=Leisingera sp. ANG-M1 TaxID=1577895 RepID=UPI00057E855D|nr:hypothetical protein [Leisingera sp. ANG-M1]KIC10877.1 hypothetical protein RA19_09045 [Leisingera sp. ANG-M1]